MDNRSFVNNKDVMEAAKKKLRELGAARLSQNGLSVAFKDPVSAEAEEWLRENRYKRTSITDDLVSYTRE
jgi:hypothetical protein